MVVEKGKVVERTGETFTPNEYTVYPYPANQGTTQGGSLTQQLIHASAQFQNLNPLHSIIRGHA